ncbi:hypothetical protein [Nocardia vaccinii]|uniref:hypothetical protein n=1 Tax=Nocardia vaccinii TaxID=1822 RepID=UPI0008346808|nr:hypothetical protein [Nocardia vaccinii]
MPRQLTTEEFLNVAFRKFPTEREEYARVWNAAADALTAYCAENSLPRPRFSARNRFGNRVWRELCPNSELGRGDV